MSFKELLKGKLTEEELKSMPRSFDIIGNKDKSIAIVDIPLELKEKEKLIAEAIIKKHKNVKTVIDKGSPRKGVYRTRDYRVILGDSNTEVMHIENGCKFLVDPTKAYFSPRESTERANVSSKIKKTETVMVFFAGVGPFSIQIAKKAKKVISIEINPDAVEYMKKNIVLNKTKNVVPVLGDVKEKAINFYATCDRILMPLPETSMDYIEDAIKCCKKNGIIHLYCFSSNDKAIKKEILKHKVKILGFEKVLPYGPSIWKTRVDLEVL